MVKSKELETEKVELLQSEKSGYRLSIQLNNMHLSTPITEKEGKEIVKAEKLELRELKEKIIEIIDRKEGETGTTFSEISKELEKRKIEIVKALHELIRENKVYEPVDGRYKVLA